MDLFVVPTIGFDLLYAFIIIRLDRRALVWINVATNPTAEWIVRQITEAFPWCYPPLARYGHSGQTHRTSIALAERFCRTVDRIDSARMPQPHCRLGRGASAPGPANLCRLLQQDQNAPVIGQGCADLPSSPADWKHQSVVIRPAPTTPLSLRVEGLQSLRRVRLSDKTI